MVESEDTNNVLCNVVIAYKIEGSQMVTIPGYLTSYRIVYMQLV
jgi:hypothetical protein